MRIVECTDKSFDGTSLVGYYTSIDSRLAFIKFVGKIIYEFGKNAAIESTDGYKCSFGMGFHLLDSNYHNVCFFTLYDYKEDFIVHIGGNKSTLEHVNDINKALDEFCLKTKTTDYNSHTYYNEEVDYGIENGIAYIGKLKYEKNYLKEEKK